jgi:hypothetical protein
MAGAGIVLNTLSMTVRQHHTVPKMYLRNFADAAGLVIQVDRDHPEVPFKASIRKALRERGFYRIETEDLAREEDRLTHDPEAIESALAEVEGAIAATLHKLQKPGSEPDKEDWYRLIQFTALQTVRGKRWRDDFASIATHHARMMVLANLDEVRVRSWLSDQGLPSSSHDVEKFVESMKGRGFPRLVPPQATLVQESLRMALGDPETDDVGLQQYLAGKRLGLLRTSRVAVLTSDEPVCWWTPDDAPVGYATAPIVWVPLGPRLVLQFREPGFDMHASGLPNTQDSLVEFVNRRVAGQAERWIVHHTSDSPLTGLQIPGREAWGEELVTEYLDDEGNRHDLFVHRRIRSDD